MIQDFIQDETGAVTVDYAVFLGAVVWMGLTVVGDVAAATMYLSQRSADRMTYESIFEEVYGSGQGQASSSGGSDVSSGSADPGGSGDSGSSDESNDSDESDGSDNDGGGSEESGSSGSGNPGNDKDVGNAGENPNGKGGWGNGSRGRSR